MDPLDKILSVIVYNAILVVSQESDLQRLVGKIVLINGKLVEKVAMNLFSLFVINTKWTNFQKKMPCLFNTEILKLLLAEK